MIPKLLLIMLQPFLFEVFKYAKILFPFLPVTPFMLTVGKQFCASNVNLIYPVRTIPLFGQSRFMAFWTDKSFATFLVADLN